MCVRQLDLKHYECHKQLKHFNKNLSVKEWITMKIQDKEFLERFTVFVVEGVLPYTGAPPFSISTRTSGLHHKIGSSIGYSSPLYIDNSRRSQVDNKILT